jgi:enoyl-CoA hydratase/carnithine racemase
MTELAPLTLAAVKEATRRMMAPVALTDAEDIVLSCYLSEDFKEGARAFLDKRKPDWKGR